MPIQKSLPTRICVPAGFFFAIGYFIANSA